MRAVAAVAALAIVMAAAAVAARGPLDPPASQAVDGLYPWEKDDDGRRFRWTERYASLFVPADVTYAYIPVRLPTDRPSVAPMGVEIITGGVEQSRTLVGNSWEVLGVKLPTVRPHPIPTHRSEDGSHMAARDLHSRKRRSSYHKHPGWRT
jgi:hypothetical protein